MKINNWHRLPSLLSLENQLRSVNCVWGIGNVLSHCMSFPVTTEGIAKLFLVQHRQSCELPLRVLQESRFRWAQRKESRLDSFRCARRNRRPPQTARRMCHTEIYYFWFVPKSCLVELMAFLRRGTFITHEILDMLCSGAEGLPNVPLTFSLHQTWLFSVASLVNFYIPMWW